MLYIFLFEYQTRLGKDHMWRPNPTAMYHFGVEDFVFFHFTNSQKFEISHFLGIFPKYMIYQDILCLIWKLWTKNFGHSEYNKAQGVRFLIL